MIAAHMFIIFIKTNKIEGKKKGKTRTTIRNMIDLRLPSLQNREK